MREEFLKPQDLLSKSLLPLRRDLTFDTPTTDLQKECNVLHFQIPGIARFVYRFRRIKSLNQHLIFFKITLQKTVFCFSVFAIF